MLNLDERLFLALNFDGGPTWDRIMLLLSGTAMWIPLYALILWLVWRRNGWRSMLLFLVLMAAAVALADDQYLLNCNYEGKLESVLEFSDGEVYRDEWVPPRRAASVYPMPNIDMARYSHLFRYRDLPYSFEMLNDSTLYFGLSSFQLTKVQRDALRDSIAGYVDVPYMIMDLRDNPGGDAYFLSEMLTWFINSPTVPLGGYSHVKTRGPLMHSWNYAPDQIVFPEYVEVEGKPGYYLIPDDAGVLYPDSTLNYRGRLYILTDETSCSAATIFPSVLVRNRRAVTVGRETMSGYHYLTAMKYNEVRLPNSKIILHVPLVIAGPGFEGGKRVRELVSTASPGFSNPACASSPWSGSAEASVS